MTPISFTHPEWLLACALTAGTASAALAIASLRARGRMRVLLGSARPSALRAALSDIALALAVALVGVALLGPRIGRETVHYAASGADLVILIDVSRSMDARDTPPSRLARARRAASDLLLRLDPEDRVALAAFSGRGVLLTPLTPDKAALVEMLPALDSGLIHPGGSHLVAGVEAALDAFEEGSDRPRGMIVLSDGEVFSRPGEDASVGVRRRGVRVWTGALGNEAGVEIPDGGAPLRDSQGRVVISHRVVGPLARLAEASGGRAFLADAWGRLDVDSLAAEIGREQHAASGGVAVRTVVVPVVLPFAGVAFALLTLDSAAGLRWRRRTPRRTRTRSARRRTGAALFVAGAVITAGGPPVSPAASESDPRHQQVAWLEARARARPLSGAELVQLGWLRAALGGPEEAAHAFRAAAVQVEDSAAAAEAYYDLGVLALRRGEFDRARDRFFDALALDVDDFEARFNLEWTLAALANQPPASAQRPPQRPRVEAPPDERQDSEAERPSPSQAAARPAERAPTSVEPLEPAERARWLARVRDDPGPALRSASGTPGAHGSRNPRADGPTW